ncbi:site-specific integrase [Amycolatopsis sp. NPDC004378]
MPNSKGKKRRFGSIRRTPLGEYQASYLAPNGKRHFAPHRFKKERDADRWLNAIESLIISGDWTDPDRVKVSVEAYGEQWIVQRPGLRPRTKETYTWLLRRKIIPFLGEVELGDLTTALIRQWRVDLFAAGTSEIIAAKAYRLLRAILNTAVNEDEILKRNPCRIRGADKEKSPKRPALTPRQVLTIAARVPARYFMLVLLAAFCSLRWGEVTALRRCTVAEDCSWVKVQEAFVPVVGQGLLEGPPKSGASLRTVAVPKAIRAKLLAHLALWVGPEPEALLFTGERSGKAVRKSNFDQRVKWTKLMADLGLVGVHFHDLRHAGNTWAAKAGSSLADLMARMGHDDVRAAIRYQHETSEADQDIADRISRLVDEDDWGPADDLTAEQTD